MMFTSLSSRWMRAIVMAVAAIVWMFAWWSRADADLFTYVLPFALGAWTAPRTWVAGELVTAAQFNTHIRDNENELRAGGLAIASQATDDFVLASSATQLTRQGSADVKLWMEVFLG